MPLVMHAAISGMLLLTQPAATSAEGLLIGAADPTIVAVDRGGSQQEYYVVATGRGIPIFRSTDLKHWERIGRVFAHDVPRWAKEAVPGASGVWAPDLSCHEGRYYLYYSVSTFGSQRSVIGLAVNETLDPASPEYRWEDRGKVVESAPGACDFNAIDPALFVDHDGRWYLFFGSFWSGIKVVELDPQTGKPRADAELQSVAARPRHPTHAIEAPFVIFHDGYYYLFASWDRCCDGADSDYKVVVGRSKQVTGPYVDAQGRPMLQGGGTLVLAGNERWRGPGHNAVLTTGDGQWLVHHTYDAENLHAQRILQIRPMSWSGNGWPEVGEPIFEPQPRAGRRGR